MLDFGLVRGLAYYNGIVFEVSHPEWQAPLGGGGRYDGLARDLGGDAMLPALGFAYNLDALSILAREAVESEDRERAILVVPAAEDATQAAFQVAQGYRGRGESVEIEVSGRTFPEAADYAARRGLKCVVLVNSDGTVRTQHI